MTLKQSVDLPQSVHLYLVKIACFRECCIKGGRGVPLGEDDSIPVRIFRIFRVMADLVGIQNRQDICNRERTAGMTALCLPRHLDDVPSQPSRRICQDLPFLS